ncbi:S-layer domain protein [Desulforamulus reducens MI-1]|uniref:S-layer domain protein n=1 Tax=Desulforamulus reducens (strain ATCC BAA-1160 / DSM 100696 / MI-1) TaxID=349161 RepID=A4J7D5_DESRM|nr:S-layer homology domain-containing protein [Desulforamulus reducens]ABO50988.1 S-layer domain protein [Desulforamulus reducens MI-1]
MSKVGKGIITLAVASSLLVGGAMADAAPGGNGKGSSDKSSKPSSSQVQKSSSQSNSGTQNKSVNGVEIKETKTNKANNDKKFGEVQSKVKYAAKDFKDTQNHWAKGPIQRLQMLGIASGFPDGTFQPEAPVTQEQVVSMVVRTLELQGEEINETTNETDEITTEQTEATEEELEDVPNWARGAVAEAKAKGIINLNRFHSGVQASRVQSMVWLAKAMDLEPVETTGLPFKDGILVSPEDMGYVMALYKEGLVAGGPGGMLNPNSAVTRAQIAALIDRMLTEEQTEDTDTFQGVETADGQQVLKIGTGENAEEIKLADEVEIYINGELAELSDLVKGTAVKVETNEEGLAIKIEQTVEESTTEDDTTVEEETDNTAENSTEDTDNINS